MKAEVINSLIDILDSDQIDKLVLQGEEDVDRYLELMEIEKNAQLLEHLENGGVEENFVLKREENDFIFDELRKTFDQRKVTAKQNIRKKELEANLKEKELLIEELRAIIQNEENIGKAFTLLNTIQEKWKLIGNIPKDQLSRIHGEYSRLRETFYYNINIYRELEDHDKKKNLHKKKEVITKMKALLKEKSIKKTNEKLHKLMAQWDEIGATYKNEWDVIREEYWVHTKKIFNKINEHYEVLRHNFEENARLKQELINKVDEITSKESHKKSAWTKATDEIQKIQTDWKKAGMASKKDNDKLWKAFKESCNNFFKKKKLFFEGLTQEYESNKIAKIALVNQAEQLKGNHNWKEATESFIKLQSNWKETKSAGPKDDNMLWQKFRAHCDEFFNQKKEFYATREDREKENLKLKESIIESVNSYNITGDHTKDLDFLKQLSEQWHKIEFVPFKEKDRINKAYTTALSAKYDSLKIGKEEKTKMIFLTKIENLKSSPHSKDLIYQEKKTLEIKMRKLESDINQYENNLGFFGRGAGADKLKKEVEKKIEKNKDLLKQLKLKLKLVKEV